MHCCDMLSHIVHFIMTVWIRDHAARYQAFIFFKFGYWCPVPVLCYRRARQCRLQQSWKRADKPRVPAQCCGGTLTVLTLMLVVGLTWPGWGAFLTLTVILFSGLRWQLALTATQSNYSKWLQGFKGSVGPRQWQDLDFYRIWPPVQWVHVKSGSGWHLQPTHIMYWLQYCTLLNALQYWAIHY